MLHRMRILKNKRKEKGGADFQPRLHLIIQYPVRA